MRHPPAGVVQARETVTLERQKTAGIALAAAIEFVLIQVGAISLHPSRGEANMRLS